MDVGRALGTEGDAGVSAGDDKLADEGIQFLITDLGKVDNRPGLDGDTGLHSLALQVPCTKCGNTIRFLTVAMVEDGGGLQDAGIDWHQLIAELHLELVQVVVVGLDELGGTDDGIKALVGMLVGNLDHVRGLFLTEFAKESLTRGDIATLDGEEDGALLGADDEAGKIGLPEGDVVLALEVGKDTRRTILGLEHGGSGGLLGQAKDAVATNKPGTVRGLDLQVTEQLLQLTYLLVIDCLDQVTGTDIQEVGDQFDAFAGCIKGSRCRVDVEEETAGTGTDGHEVSLPHLQSPRNALGIVAIVEGPADDDVGLDERVTEDHLEGGDDVVGGVGQLAIEELFDGLGVDGGHPGEGQLEGAIGATGTGSGKGDLDGSLVLLQFAKTVHDVLPIIGDGEATKFAILVVLLGLVEDDAIGVAEDLRLDPDFVLEDFSHGQGLDLKEVAKETDSLALDTPRRT